jgi:hypothetical protein
MNNLLETMMDLDEPHRSAIRAAVTEIATPKRINVSVSPAMLAAIENVIVREQVTLTESVRRLIGYGDFVYRTVKDEGELFVRGQDGSEVTVVII